MGWWIILPSYLAIQNSFNFLGVELYNHANIDQPCFVELSNVDHFAIIFLYSQVQLIPPNFKLKTRVRTKAKVQR